MKLIMGFAEKELKEFVHNERKVVSVYFDVTNGLKIDSKKKNAVIISRKSSLMK